MTLENQPKKEEQVAEFTGMIRESYGRSSADGVKFLMDDGCNVRIVFVWTMRGPRFEMVGFSEDGGQATNEKVADGTFVYVDGTADDQKELAARLRVIGRDRFGAASKILGISDGWITAIEDLIALLEQGLIPNYDKLMAPTTAPTDPRVMTRVSAQSLRS